MNKPIIDPSTLSEEQREAIKEMIEKAYSLSRSGAKNHLHLLAGGQILAISKIFGSKLFNKGE